MVISTFAFIYFGILDVIFLFFFVICLAVVAPLFFGKDERTMSANARAAAEAKDLSHSSQLRKWEAEAAAKKLRDELGDPEAL